MTERAISDAELDTLVRLTEEATTAFLNGDMERYLELTQREHQGGGRLLPGRRGDGRPD